MQAFRVKAPYHEHSYPEPSLKKSASHSKQGIFPFRNRKLKDQKKQVPLMEVRPLKSRAQVSRKRLESIPLLQNIRINSDKVSILKSAKDQYNLFLRKSSHQESYCDKVMVINGESHRRTASELSRRTSSGTSSHSRTSSNWLLRRSPSHEIRPSLTMPQDTPHLHIYGNPKSLSPFKNDPRTSHCDYLEIKI